MWSHGNMGSRPFILDLTCVQDGRLLSGSHTNFWVRGFTFLSTLTFVRPASISLKSGASFAVPCHGKCDKRRVPKLLGSFLPASTVYHFFTRISMKLRDTTFYRSPAKMADSTVAKRYGMLDHWRSLMSCSIVASTAFLYGWETINFDTLQAMPGFLEVRQELPWTLICPPPPKKQKQKV